MMHCTVSVTSKNARSVQTVLSSAAVATLCALQLRQQPSRCKWPSQTLQFSLQLRQQQSQQLRLQPKPQLKTMDTVKA
jgi:phage tail sheath gpL-like